MATLAADVIIYATEARADGLGAAAASYGSVRATPSPLSTPRPPHVNGQTILCQRGEGAYPLPCQQRRNLIRRPCRPCPTPPWPRSAAPDALVRQAEVPRPGSPRQLTARGARDRRILPPPSSLSECTGRRRPRSPAAGALYTGSSSTSAVIAAHLTCPHRLAPQLPQETPRDRNTLKLALPSGSNWTF